MKDKVEKTAEEMIYELEHELAILERQYRRCEAHGAKKAMEALLPELENMRMIVEGEHQMFRLVMSNR